VKHLLRRLPFPFVLAGIRTTIAVPVLAICAWFAQKCPLNFHFLVPPTQLYSLLIFGVTAHAACCLLNNLGVFASSIDFLFLFRMTGIFWTSLFGFVVFGERISPSTGIALCVVIVGLIISMYDFQWSTEFLSSKLQAIVLVSTLIMESVNSLFYKRAFTVLEHMETDFSIFSYALYEVLGSLFPLAISIRLNDMEAADHLSQIFSPLSLGLLILITGIGQTGLLCYVYLHENLALVSLGVLNLLKVLVSLVASHLIFAETTWSYRQMLGAVLLFTGSMSYIWTRAVDDTSKPVEDEMTLLDSANPDEF
jgi:drug/metabolite transporter (DMT)-like permease